jgi:hypothetical protein
MSVTLGPILAAVVVVVEAVVVAARAVGGPQHAVVAEELAVVIERATQMAIPLRFLPLLHPGILLKASMATQIRRL